MEHRKRELVGSMRIQLPEQTEEVMRVKTKYTRKEKYKNDWVVRKVNDEYDEQYIED